MSKTLKMSKKKLTAGWILFIIGAIALAVVIALFFVGDIPFFKDNFWIMPVSLSLYMVCTGISFFLNRSYRKNSIAAGASSTVLYVFQFILLAPFIIIGVIGFIYLLMHGGVGQGEEQLKRIKITDDDGNVYILTQLYVGGIDYRDQNGDIWTTRDGGLTFECVSKVKVKDKDGNSYDLTRKSDFYGSDCTDQNGEVWQTRDNGETYERKTKIMKDEDGNEYYLTPTSDNSPYYIDQNGDWWQWGGGNTYKRVKM